MPCHAQTQGYNAAYSFFFSFFHVLVMVLATRIKMRQDTRAHHYITTLVTSVPSSTMTSQVTWMGSRDEFGGWYYSIFRLIQPSSVSLHSGNIYYVYFILYLSSCIVSSRLSSQLQRLTRSRRDGFFRPISERRKSFLLLMRKDFDYSL